MVARTTGEQYEIRHAPLVHEGEARFCWFVLPSGRVCGRPVNFVPTGFTPTAEGRQGHWRHNPRPYSNH